MSEHRRWSVWGVASSLFILSLLSISSCVHPAEDRVPEPPPPPPQAAAPSKTVQASFYGEHDGLAGKRTASGEKLDPNALTAAHPSLPFGTKLEVRNPKSGRAVQVRVNDRGPFVRGRSLDLSPAAASQLGLKQHGVAKVEMQVVDKPEGAPATKSERTRTKVRKPKAKPVPEHPAPQAEGAQLTEASASEASPAQK